MSQMCHYCDAPATDREHIVPRALRGKNAVWNIVPSCRSCNSKKGSAWPTCTCDICVSAQSRHLNGPEAERYRTILRNHIDALRQRRAAMVEALGRCDKRIEAAESAWDAYLDTLPEVA